MGSTEARVDYMGSSILMGVFSNADLQLQDEWKVNLCTVDTSLSEKRCEMMSAGAYHATQHLCWWNKPMIQMQIIFTVVMWFQMQWCLICSVSICFLAFCDIFYSLNHLNLQSICFSPFPSPSFLPLSFQWDLCPWRLAVGHFPGDHFTLHHARPHQDRHEAAGVFHPAIRHQQAGLVHLGPWPLPAPQNPRHQHWERSCRALWASLFL